MQADNMFLAPNWRGGLVSNSLCRKWGDVLWMQRRRGRISTKMSFPPLFPSAPSFPGSSHSHKAYHPQFKVIGVKSMLGKSLAHTQKVTPRIKYLSAAWKQCPNHNTLIEFGSAKVHAL
jgi:hypothetical protein